MKIRPRRLRGSAVLRKMVAETSISPDQLVQPAFIIHGKGIREEITSMPGQFRFSVDTIGNEAKEIKKAGIPSMLLFGIPEKKDEKASGAYAKDGIVQMSIAAIKEAVPEMYVITDVCLCEYMSHGHCGITKGHTVDNDPSLEMLAKTAASHAHAGADMVAPSDMMDGRVAAIRTMLDKEGFENTPIMSYAAKYASAFYGPFRDAAESAPKLGDRKTYQMDPPNVREAMKEIALDIEEGADIVMVKPALAYLDVIAKARERFDVPIAAYNVSGEYSIIKAAAKNGWIDEKRAIMEMLISIKRAGADIIITYFAKEIGCGMPK
ncbi:MAG: porphobilinogen synthase [Deltaproteobacteria bacterium CG_4_10_14_0_2_um_filter_43_8]|nr:MAG: porphobilinogen synthase [Deltaproteobacteria bacterium CG11_big_fil_rev_8_21_14_0_20_49_13]PJA19817.1 MAG: porphobilinogen synthase [Deltaproteobacteria bacterium CG_4_10_14_0_2_um_filter_43_8]